MAGVRPVERQPGVVHGGGAAVERHARLGCLAFLLERRIERSLPGKCLVAGEGSGRIGIIDTIQSPVIRVDDAGLDEKSLGLAVQPLKDLRLVAVPELDEIARREEASKRRGRFGHVERGSPRLRLVMEILMCHHHQRPLEGRFSQCW